MFDRHVVAGDDDAFQEQPHEPLATGEVEAAPPRLPGGAAPQSQAPGGG
jgi:hypothetical protein